MSEIQLSAFCLFEVILWLNNKRNEGVSVNDNVILH